MKSETRMRVEAWLEFGEDLGLAPYFRDRAPVAKEPGPPAAAESKAVASVPQVSAPKSAGAPTRLAAPVVTIAPGLSLFEAIERVEGDTLPQIRSDIGDCTRCRLHKGRTNIVFGVGNPQAKLVFVGEGPGHDEDVQGEPFVGRAGKLLTQMIEAMGLRRQDVYICNVIKCRPPQNRNPESDEIATCSPFLFRQLAAIQPKVIVCLGNVAAQTLLETNQSISRFRGQWFDFRGAKLISTYHPAYLLRNPSAKGDVWRDLQKVMDLLGLESRRR